MDLQTACILNQVTSRFYREHADSFSATRHAGWPGWERALDGEAGAAFRAGGEAPAVLDVACGNMRFERFLQERFPESGFRVWAVDNCAPLATGDADAFTLTGEGLANRVSFYEFDVMERLLAGDLAAHLPERDFDLVACFGFMHHVPGWENRVQLLRALAEKVKPGGSLVVSFWQFLNSPELAAKAQEAHVRGLASLRDAGLDPAQLEEGDFLLGWQNEQNAFRYCHNFTQSEVERLAQEAGLTPQLTTQFQADGRTQNLNAYLVFGR
ncbi:MAG: class I SAM-dependent methyltransferase [Coriobacteriia bacterium]|nr:class I SAM-dependent methyltransferase [Coriobacteriia bacterium]